MLGKDTMMPLWDAETDELIDDGLTNPQFLDEFDDFDDEPLLASTLNPAIVPSEDKNRDGIDLADDKLVDAFKFGGTHKHSLMDTNRCHVMLAAVIEALCNLVEPNHRKRNKLIRFLAKSLISMNLAPPLAFDDCLYSVREHMRCGIAQLLTSSHSSLTPAHNTPLLQDSVFPASTSSNNAANVLSALTSGPRNRIYRRVASEGESNADLWGCRYEKDFEQLRALGKGGFGHVFMVVCRLDGCHYAVKKIAFDVGDFSLCYKVFREVKLLARLNHPHVVRYHSAWIELDSEPETRHTIRGRRDSHSSPRNGAVIRELSNESNTNENYDRSKMGRLHRSLSNPSVVFIDSNAPSSPAPAFLDHSSPLLHDRNVYSQGGSEPSHNSPRGFWAHPSSGSSSVHNNSGWSAEAKALVPLENELNMQRVMRHFTPITRSLLLYLQMELCQSTLRDFLHKRNVSASQEDRFCCVEMETNERILRQLVSALDYIHSQGLIHRDIKPSNIFLRGDNNDVLVGDFGLACLAASDESLSYLDTDSCPLVEEVTTPTTQEPTNFTENEHSSDSSPMRHSKGVGTLTYSAPEQLSANLYSSKVDIFSAGVVAYELYFPFKTYMEKIHLLMKLREGQTDLGFQQKWPVEAGIIGQMVSRNPSFRPSANQLLSKSFFSTKDPKVETLEKEVELLRRVLLEHGISHPTGSK